MITLQMKKIIAWAMVLVIAVTMLPCMAAPVDAADYKAAVTNLGTLGSVDISKAKTKTGNWYKIKVNDNTVFCLDLGLTCHTGFVYTDKKSTISSDSKDNVTSLKAKIGYWYSVTKKSSNKAWVYAQALIWSVEESCMDEPHLTDIIRQVSTNTGYFDPKDAGSMYKEIFGGSQTVTCDIITWKYNGTADGKYVQRLMEIVATDKDVELEHATLTKRYRQRITLRKKNENGAEIPLVQFTLVAKNIDELYSFKANGWGDAESGEVDEDDTQFEISLKTDSNGKITYKFDYQLQSEDYYYVKSSELKEMTEDDKKKVKKELDEKGYKYASDLTEKSAKRKAENDLQSQLDRVSNEYIITEDAVYNKDGTVNKNILLDSNFAKGKKITLTSDASWVKEKDGWPDTTSGMHADYELAYQLNVVNKFRKIAVNIRKSDGNSSDENSYGDATLDGAEYKLYEDRDCHTEATVYDMHGNKKTSAVYITKNGKFETDYLICGKEYYLKEVKAPSGYLLNQDINTIKIDAEENNEEYTIYKGELHTKDMPILGKVRIQKLISDGSTGLVKCEDNAQFQVYLKSAGSFEKADPDYERDIITTDKLGNAVTKALYYGTYIVHQMDTGGHDTQKISDFEVNIHEHEKTYFYLLNNAPFQAYLRVVKIDKKTKKEVLKSGTTYKIYKYNQSTGKETVYHQTYSDGHGVTVIDTFKTDETGTIMTVKPVETGIYRIYETASAPGLNISTKYIEVDVSSNNPNCVVERDEEGNTYITVTVSYENDETYGKLTIVKTGEVLKAFEKNEFVYEDSYLKGTEFKIYAAENIVTQDNQGKNWFEQGEHVATVITGEGAVFTKECEGICSYVMDKSTGAITMNLPLGKYIAEETKTNYGYVIDQNKKWEIHLEWKNSKEPYVIDSTEATDEEGVLRVQNDRAKADLSVVKKDKKTGKGVKNAKFGLYTADNIYSDNGKMIVKADTLLTTVTTDSMGYAKVNIDIPFMSENYGKNEEDLKQAVYNSGNYYYVELFVPDGYYLDEDRIDIHLVYKDADTPIISLQSTKTNVQTETEISKVKLTNGQELSGCKLVVSDTDGNQILNWVTGDEQSAIITENADILGYVNLNVEMNEKGNVVIGGLFHGKEYVLSETKPADGFVTAENIHFCLEEGSLQDGTVITEAYIKNKNGEVENTKDNKVIMKDDITKVEFKKIASDTKKRLEGAEYSIYDGQKNKVYSFTTSAKENTKLEGKLKIGETYTFIETKAPKGYKKAGNVEFTVDDTGKTQIIEVVDEKIEKKKIPFIPNTPQTGIQNRLGCMPFFAGMMAAVLILSGRKRRKKNEGL